jgi:hypothetical protein
MLAVIISALIVDAAIETFWHGSPVRWTVIAIAATYVLTSALMWRCCSRSTKLTVSILAFALILAISAWVPEGLENGVRLLGLSTSAVLSLATVVGIAIGTIVIAAETRLPRAARWTAATLGAYGVIAFAQGIVSGVPFRGLLAGASFWRPLPIFLQGAFVGGVLLVAIALVIATVRGGVRAAREGTRLRALQRVIVLAAALSLVITALPFHSGSTPKTASGSLPLTEDAGARLALLDDSLRAIADGERESPRDRWDPGYVVQQLGRDPQRIFEWVRDNTYWIPYHGALRGPVGVLMDRQGNSLDRAMLLATLLEKAGHTVRLARGELPRELARELVPSLVAQRASAARMSRVHLDVAPDDQASIQAVAAQYHLDTADIERSLNSLTKQVSTLYADLHARVAQHSQRLVEAVGKPKNVPDWTKRLEAAVEACRDHWWVQRHDGDAWDDLDLLSLEQAGKTALTSPNSTSSLTGLDTSLHHDLVVRVIAEHTSAGVLKEDRILEHTVTPSDLIGDILVLQFWPSSWPTELAADPNARLGFRSAALEQTEWTALLMSKENVLARGTMAATGATRAVSGNPFGGLGRRIADGAKRDSEASVSQLTAVWIEYEFHAPGGSTTTVRRVVFDLLGPSRRAAGASSQVRLNDNERLTRSLSLMMRTEMLPLATELAPEFGVHVSAQSVLGHRELLHAIARPDLPLDEAKTTEILEHMAPGVSALLEIAVGRFAAASPPMFVDRLNLLTRHQFPIALSDGIHFVDAVDIVSNEMGVDLSEEDGFTARLNQGVLDTNIEAMLHGIPSSTSNTADAFNTSHDWVTLLPSNRAEMEKLQISADVRRSISADLDSGHAVVVPRAHQRVNELDAVGWWRIDPVSGDTLGVGADGWGQDLAEDFVQHVLWRYAKDFALQYAFCQAIPQVLKDTVDLLQEYRDRLPSWLPPLAQSKDRVTLLKESHRGCLIGAMIGTGVSAALPFLMFTLRLSGRGLMSMASRGASAAEAGANPLAKTVPGFKVQPMGPPRGSPPPGEPLGPPRGSPPPGEPLGPPRGSPPPGEGGSPQGPPRGSPPPGLPRDFPRPAKIPQAPRGEGPVETPRDYPELQKHLEETPDSDLAKTLSPRRDAAELYREADAASRSAYNAARAAGADDQAARQISSEARWTYLNQGRGDYSKPVPGGDTFLEVRGAGTLQVGAAGFGGPGVKW